MRHVMPSLQAMDSGEDHDYDSACLICRTSITVGSVEAGTWRWLSHMPMIIPEHYVKQQYLPDELVGRKFYRPSDNGYEKTIGERLKHLRERGY